MLLTTLAVISAFAPVRAQTSPPESTPVDPRFGIIEAFWEPEDAAELNVGWDRILFYWNEIQPTGPDDWNTLHVLEEWLVDAQAHDRMVMGLLKNTPAWATDGEPYSGVPRGLYLPVDDPDNLWAEYVRKVVEYYAPRGVHHWIVWNEPEIAPGVYGHEFGGSTRDYYQLLKVAYQVAKEHDPQAVIHLAGWSYWHDPTWLNQFLRVAAADPDAPANNYFFDAVTLHIYFRVETVEELVNEVWDIQERFGLRKPIWINETNASPNLDPDWPVERPAFQVDLDQQAWYIVQAHALGFGAQAARIGVYKLIDVLLPPGGESFGILRPDRSRRPAFDAYKTTQAYLGGFLYPVGRQQARDFYVFTFKRKTGLTRVLWARNSATVTLDVPALADEALLVSAVGDARTIRARDGVYRIRLPGARCAPACDIGGPPYFLVEQPAEDFRVADVPAVNPQQVTLATASPTPTYTPTPSATPTRTPRSTLSATQQAEMTASPVASASPTNDPTATPTATETPTASLTPSATATQAATRSIAVSLPTVTREAQGSIALNYPPATQVTMASTSEPIETMTTPDAPAGASASWLFLGAAAALAAGLVLVIVRQRNG